MGHGSLLLGHSHPAVVEAVQRQAALGTHYGACHALEIGWAERVRRLMPAAERVRFTNSGTEATLMGVRVSRIVTVGPRSEVRRTFSWLARLADPRRIRRTWGNRAVRRRSPMPGIPAGVMDDLVIIPPNDPVALNDALAAHKPACVILEATGGHWGAVPMRGRSSPPCASVRPARIAADSRRSHHRLPRCAGRRAGGARGSPRSDLAGEDSGGRLARWLPRGTGGGHGSAQLRQPLRAEDEAPGDVQRESAVGRGGDRRARPRCHARTGERANALGRALRESLNALFRAKSVDWVAYGEFSMVTVMPGYAGPRPTSDDFIPYDNDYVRLDRKIDPALTHAFRRALLLEGVDFFGWRAMLSSEHTDDDLEQTVAAMSGTIDRLREDGLIG